MKKMIIIGRNENFDEFEIVEIGEIKTANKKEIDIVKDIKNDIPYFTKDQDEKLTPVNIYDDKHIRSISNKTQSDNIKKLPITI
jgi:hypothetical protein